MTHEVAVGLDHSVTYELPFQLACCLRRQAPMQVVDNEEVHLLLEQSQFLAVIMNNFTFITYSFSLNLRDASPHALHQTLGHEDVQ